MIQGFFCFFLYNRAKRFVMNLSYFYAYKSITGGIKVKIKISKEIIVTG